MAASQSGRSRIITQGIILLLRDCHSGFTYSAAYIPNPIQMLWLSSMGPSTSPNISKTLLVGSREH